MHARSFLPIALFSVAASLVLAGGPVDATTTAADTAVCPAPANLRTTGVGADYADLVWDAPPGADDYEVLASTESGSGYFTYFTTRMSGGRASGLSARPWYFVVRARCGSSRSGTSAEVSVTVGGSEAAPGPTTSTTVAPTNTTAPTPTAPGSGGSLCLVSPPSDPRAVEAAINGCPAGAPGAPTTVRFPPGASYHLDDRVVLLRPHDMILDGNGSTFRATYPSGLAQRSQFTLFKPRDVTVRNFLLEGNFYPDPAVYPSRQVMSYYCEASHGVAVYGGRGVTIEDSRSNRACGDGFGVSRSSAFSDDYPLLGEAVEFPTDITFQRLRTTTPARMCWGPTGGIRILVQDSYCGDAWYGGIDVEKDAPDEPVQDVRIRRNTFDGFNLYGVALPVAAVEGTHLVRDIWIEANTFLTEPDSECAPVINMGTPAYTAPDGSRASLENVNVTGNDIRSMVRAVSFWHVDGGSILSNTIRQVAPPAGYTPFGWCGESRQIVVEDSTNVAVSGSTMSEGPAPSTPTTTVAPTTTTTVAPTTTTTVAPTTTTTVAPTTTTKPPKPPKKPCLLGLVKC